MKDSPGPGHQFQGPGDAGKEKQAYGDVGNEQQGRIAVLEEDGTRQTEENGGKQIECKQLDEQQRTCQMGQVIEQGKQP